MKKPAPAPRPLGSIHRDELLPLALFGERLGLASRALADAQRHGLRTITFGRRKYVLGADAYDWLDGLGIRHSAGEGQQ